MKHQLIISAAVLLAATSVTASEAAQRFELLDHSERPIGSYTSVVNQSGFQSPIEWKASSELPESVRLRVVFEGQQRTGIRFSALYLKP